MEIDWAGLRNDPELRRPGSPVFASSGWRKTITRLYTVALLLFAPWVFSKRLRIDEPIGPAFFVPFLFTTIFVSLALAAGSPGTSILILVFVGVNLIWAILESVLLASISTNGQSPYWTWRFRFRAWLPVNLYAQPLVLFWPFFMDNARALHWFDFCYYWPASIHDWYLREWAILFTMWRFAIITTFMVIRNRPRWLAIAALPLAWTLAALGLQLADKMIPRLAR